jgi:hypothetical protein
MASARDARVYVEAVVQAQPMVREARVYVEAVIALVPPPAVGGWAVGMVRMGPN